MTDDVRQSIIKAINVAKASQYGVTAVKVELEANLGRDYDNYGDEDECNNYFRSRLEELGLVADGEPTGALAYFNFYNDGSVDSELTFTVKLDNPENVFLIPQIIEIWNEFCAEITDEPDINGAGMHIAFINHPQARYSYHDSTETMSQRRRFQNYRRSMTMLLPALFFLGASGDTTRRMGYRVPRVSRDDKYSAIFYVNGAIEFRVFDTCYQNVNQVLDNIVVMANTLKYWRDEFRPTGINRVINSIRFGNDEGNDLTRLFSSTQHIDVLNFGINKLKPSYYTVRELKKQRKFSLNKGTFRNQDIAIRKDAEVAYTEYEERFTWSAQVRRHRIMAELMDSHMNRNRGRLAQSNAAADLSTLEDRVQLEIEAYNNTKTPLDRFVADEVRRILEAKAGRWELTA